MFGWTWNLHRQLGEVWALEFNRDVQVLKGMKRGMKKLENRIFSQVSSGYNVWKVLLR